MFGDISRTFIGYGSENKMNDKNEEIQQFYKDALYFQLIRKGYTTQQVEQILQKLFRN